MHDFEEIRQAMDRRTQTRDEMFEWTDKIIARMKSRDEGAELFGMIVKWFRDLEHTANRCNFEDDIADHLWLE